MYTDWYVTVHFRVQYMYTCTGPLHSAWEYIYYWNLQFLHNVITIKVKVLLPQVNVTLANFGYPVYTLWFYCSQGLLNYLVFQYFDFEPYLMKVIQRTWWRWFSVPDEGDSAYLMKVIQRTWWRWFSVPDEGDSRSVPCALSLISTFVLYNI
jgi:hypothetical protein